RNLPPERSGPTRYQYRFLRPVHHPCPFETFCAVTRQASPRSLNAIGTPGKHCPPGSWRFRNLEDSSLFGLVLVFDSIAEEHQGKSISTAGAPLGDLQIEGHTFAIDEDGSRVQKLLAGAIVLLVAAQRGKRKEEFHGLGYSGRRLAGEVDVRAEADPVKILRILKIRQQRTDEVGNMVVESRGCQLVARSSGRDWQGGV